MDKIQKIFKEWPAVEGYVKADGLLTALCRACCEEDYWHSFTISKSSSQVGLIHFIYETTNELEYAMRWYEEVSIKEDYEEEDYDYNS